MADNTPDSAEPDQIQRPSQYPTATKIENGTAYDISGKALGPVNVAQQQSSDPFAGGTPAPSPQAAAKDVFAGGTPAPAPSAPGYLQRLRESVGVPTLDELSAQGAEAANHPIQTAIEGEPIVQAVRGVYGWGKRAGTGILEGLNEEKEAAQNIAHGGPIGENLGKAASGVVHGAVGGIPFIGEPMESAGQDIVNKNYAGAAGSLTGVIGQVALSALHGAGETEQLSKAETTHNNAKSVYETRFKESQTAATQADTARQQAEQAASDEAAGKGKKQQTVDAWNNASAAAANAKKAQTALADASETRANAAADMDRLTRSVQRAAAKTKAVADEKQTKATAGALDDFKKMAPPSRTGPAAYTDKDLQIARGYQELEHLDEPLESVQDHANALQKISDDIDNKVQPYTKQVYPNEPITTNVMMDVRDALEENPRTDFVEKGMAGLESYNLTDPTMSEADDIRAQLNAENRAVLKKETWDVATALRVDPAFAARYAAADSLRTGIEGTLVDKGVNGVRQLRRDQASIIRVKSAVERQIGKGSQVVRDSGQSGFWRKAAQKAVNVGGTVGGAKVAGPLGAYAGERLTDPMGRIGRLLAPGDLTKDQLGARSMKVTGAGVPITEIIGKGASSVPPTMPIPPAPTSTMSEQDIRELQRENSPLHSALSTHYGEPVGDSSYGELESRLMEDIAGKKQHGAEIDPAEKTLLGKINDQNSADKLAQQQAQQEAALNEEKPPMATLPENPESVLQIKGGLQAGMDTQKGLVHDLAHAIVADEVMGNKLPSMGIQSHLHPNAIANGHLATAAFDWSKFVDEDGNIDPKKVKNSIDDIATVYVAGGVANDLYHDIPLGENHHLGADLGALRRLMAKVGIAKPQQVLIVERAGARAAEILNRPGTEDILHDHAAVREPGLENTMHFSPERIQQVVADLKGGISAESTELEPTAGNGKSNREAGGANGNARGQGGARPDEAGAENRVAETVGQGREGHAEGKGKAGEEKPVNPALAEQPSLTHKPTETGGEVRLDTNQGDLTKNRGMLKYTMKGDEAAVTASNLDPAFRGQGLGTEMYERAAQEAKAKGAKALTSDLGGQTSMDAAKVWDRLSEKHPGEIEKVPSKTGSPGYRWNLEKPEVKPYVDYGHHSFAVPEDEGLKPENPALGAPRLRPEQTTGDEAADKAIREGGGVPRGTMGHVTDANHVKMFDSPQTGGTLGIKNGEPITAEAVRRQIAESDAKFAGAEQIAAHEKNGGSTFTPEGKNLAGTDTHAVGAYPERTLEVDKLTPEVLAKFKADNADVLSKGEHAVGTWKDPDTGKTVLDVSKTIQNRGEAVAAGKAANQKAIYHLGKGEEIPTGGTGGLKPENPALSKKGNDAIKKLEGSNEEYAKPIPYPHDAPFTNKTAPSVILPDGRIIPARLSHADIAGEAGFKDDFDGVQDLLKHTDGVRVIYPDRGRGNVGIQSHANPNDTQIPLIQTTLKRAGEVGIGDGRNFVWDLGAGKDHTSGEGNINDYRRAIEERIKPENPALSPDTISTRVPQGKNATENPLEGAPLHIDRAALEASPQKLQDKFADKARNIAGVKIPKNITDNGKVYDRFARHVADNLKYIYEQTTPEEKTNNAKWYESANKLTKDIADKSGLTHQQAAGVTAAMSPQMDWDANVSLAKRIVDIYKNHKDEPVTPEMIQKGREIVQASRVGAAKGANANLDRILGGIEGKSISQLTDPFDRAAALRLYDEVNNERTFPRIDPGTGNEMETRTNDDGSPTNVAWGSLKNIAKAMSIMDDGSRENISKQVGSSHKVRNFYNNIIDPKDPNSVTIDTHAVGAGTMLPLGGNAKEVLDNFGAGGKSTATGVKGTYPLYASGYRLAAKELGLLPRELQSVTWEKIRNLFPAEWKTKENLQAVKDEWQKHVDGEQSAKETRDNIVKMASEAQAVKQAKLQTAKENQAPGRINALDFLKAFGHNREGGK